jgi:hypothetical protein
MIGRCALLTGIAALFLATGAMAKPLTPSQVRTYQDLIGIGITKKDAERVARDPGVKKGEWGWVCEGGGGKLMRVRGKGAKHKNNAVCE